MKANTIMRRAESAREKVCVWTIRLPLDTRDLQPLASLLSEEERDRAERFHRAADRERFVAAHAGLRMILGEQLGRAPADLDFASEAGKPRLRGSNLRFSLSHSGDYALVAVARDLEVGVDLERVPGELDVYALAARFYSPAEACRLASRPADQQGRAFIEMWVQKEALLKAHGLGIEQLAAAVPGGPFTVHKLSAPDGYAAALALDSATCDIRMRKFEIAPVHALQY